MSTAISVVRQCALLPHTPGWLEGLLDKTNTASTVWADTAYRSKTNEDFMEKQGFVSKVLGKSRTSRLCPGISRNQMLESR